MSNFHQSFTAALIARRAQKLSLLESYCLAQRSAGIPAAGDEALLKLQSVTEWLLNSIEEESAKHALAGVEPAYHNRQHIADAILAIGLLLQRLVDLDIYEKQLLLLVMLVHDYGHRGMTHKLPDMSHEEESIQLLRASALMRLPAQDIFFVEQCIVGTESKNIIKVSEEHLSNELDQFHLMRALVNDADIAASFIPELGSELSRLILIEGGLDSPSESDIAKSLAQFLSRARITTQVAREALGLG